MTASVVAATADAELAKPRPPRVTLLTATEEGALRRKAIKVEVDSSRGSEARVTATFVVDGYPEDFTFGLGPKTGKLRDGEATVRLPLSPRQREVLDFAIKSCRGATLGIEARVGERTGRLHAGLRRPREC